jgi:hypothetical protein
VNVGDLVRRKDDEAFESEGYAIVLGFQPRGWSRDPDPNCDVWNDAILMFSCDPEPCFVMREQLEVTSESR